jgi:putative phosphoesterase
MTRIGLVSDTHGLLRPEVLAYLAGSDHIVHAGDVCEAAVLERLRALAPVTAVRGNNDDGDWAGTLRDREDLVVEGVRIHVVHDLAELRAATRGRRREPRVLNVPAGVRVVVSGHSHHPAIEERDGVLFVNPGSAGPRRFRLPIACGELLVDGDAVTARLAQPCG